MKRASVFALAVAALALPACVTFESYVMRATYDPDRGYGTVTYVYHNLQSTEEAAEGQAADFHSLIEAWREDKFLVDQLHEEQLYVKSRDLRIEEGVLAGRQTALFKELEDINIALTPGDSLVWSPGRDLEVIRTNGTLEAPPDGGRVVWPPGTTRFEVEVRVLEFRPQSDFARTFRKWTKER